jgi:hypothetical protein
MGGGFQSETNFGTVFFTEDLRDPQELFADLESKGLVSTQASELCTASYSEKANISFGVYNLTWPTPQDEMNPEIMQTRLENALRWTDKYVWYYTEDDDWLIPGKMPEAWLEAVRAARQKE